MMNKIIINNRKNKKIVILVETKKNQKGLAFVMHGLSGSKDELHIKSIATTFVENGYTTVRFDTTNTFGESYGRYEDATLTNYYEDLEDVLKWSKTQTWYEKPFILAGHSLGGIAILLYTEKFPQNVRGIAPLSTVVSGQLSMEAPRHRGKLELWEKSGWREEISQSVPWRIKRLPWSHVVDRLKYDVIPNAKKLTMPVLLIVGDHDESTPYKHQKILFDALPAKKEFHIIKNAPHTFVDSIHLKEINRILDAWIKSV